MSFSGGRAQSGVSTNAGGVFNCTLTVGAGSNAVTADAAGLTNDTWESYTNTWTATETGMLRLEFSNVSGTPLIDNVSDVKREQ